MSTIFFVLSAAASDELRAALDLDAGTFPIVDEDENTYGFCNGSEEEIDCGEGR